jgi:DNA-binding SARP family transcriptional activator
VFHLLNLDPLREGTYRQAMRLFVQMGQRENALRQYMICQSVLEHELGVAPSSDTTALYRHIRDSTAGNT